MRAKNESSDDYFNALRKKEYARLDRCGQVYLDYTGGNIHPESLVDQHCRFLQRAVYGNPHSTNPASQLSGEGVNEARKKVLEFFNAPDYHCVFTHNASGALKTVGECYPFRSNTHFLLTADNHNSVNGIRLYGSSKGAGCTYSSMNAEDLTINEAELAMHLQAHGDKENKLFAYPAQSNAPGVRHSLEWIARAQEQGWDVLLDAAAFVPASKLDLSVWAPDFVSLSFYKMFGYPTGLGCLLVKKSTWGKLIKPWFAGGTVHLSSVTHDSYFLKEDHEKFEDGTVNYLDIPAVTEGLDFMTAITMERINGRMKELSLYLLSALKGLRHSNGRSLVKVYGPQTVENRGGNLLINFLDVSGQQYPFEHIEQLANEEHIALRTGCFCNPGIDELNNRLSENQLKRYFTSRRCGDYDDMIHFLQQRRGAVRISVGLPTTRSDIDAFVRFAESLIDKSVPQAALSVWDRRTELRI